MGYIELDERANGLIGLITKKKYKFIDENNIRPKHIYFSSSFYSEVISIMRGNPTMIQGLEVHELKNLDRDMTFG